MTDDTTITIEDGDVALSVSGADPDAAALEAALEAYREAAEDDPTNFTLPDSADFDPADLPDPDPSPVPSVPRPWADPDPQPRPWADGMRITDTTGDHTPPGEAVRDLALNTGLRSGNVLDSAFERDD